MQSVGHVQHENSLLPLGPENFQKRAQGELCGDITDIRTCAAGRLGQGRVTSGSGRSLMQQGAMPSTCNSGYQGDVLRARPG